MDKPTTAKTTKRKAAASKIERIKAIVERRHYSPSGERLSPPPFTQDYSREEWMAFQESGPKLGFWVVEIIEAPDGLDLSYSQMSPKS